jgi:hypothetical protein
MALLKFKRSAVPAKVPSIADLDLGELAINTYDGKVYTKKDDGTQSIVEVGGTASTTNTILLPVRNNTGATLTKGTAVYINGALGQNPTVTKAIATGDATSAQTLGLVATDLPNNTVGNVTLIGSLDDVDTSAYTDGAQLYLSPTTAGALTATKPYAPSHLVYMAVVEYAHPTHGKLFVKVQNGYEMDELHDVSAQNPANNDGLFYNTTSGLWEKKSIATALGYTPASTSGPTFSNGITVNNGDNQVQIAFDGNLEIVRAAGNGYIDFKNTVGEDYDSRIQQIGSGFAMSGMVSAADEFRAPIFRDTPNTAYFIDPAGTSNISGLTLDGTLAGVTGRFAKNQTAGNYTTAALWTESYGTTATGIAFHISGVVGKFLEMRTDGILYWPGIFNSDGELRAPIFRDMNNGAFYLDLDGNSVLNTLYVRNGSIEAKAAQASQFGYSSSYRTVVLGNEYLTTISMGVDVSGNASGSFNGQGEGREVLFRNGVSFITPNAANNSYLNVMQMTDGVPNFTAYATAGGSFRAPLFYDTPDTSWFLDPSSTSVLNVVRANVIQHVNGTSAITLTDGSYLYFRSPDNGIRMYLGGADPANYYDNDTHYFRNRATAIRAELTSNDGFKVGPNTSGQYTRLGGNGGAADMCTVSASNGNFHIDAKTGNNLYLSWYNVATTYVGGEIAATVFRDRDNAAYYVDPTGTSNIVGLNVNGSAVFRSDWTTRFQSGSDFVDGTLVTTDIVATGFAGESFLIEITGKSYSASNLPFKVVAQGYLYADTVINYTGISYGGDFATYIKVFEEGGVLKFWWPRISYWNSFNVNVMAMDGPTNNTITRNRVTAISNSTEPTGTKKQQINLTKTLKTGDAAGSISGFNNPTTAPTANTIAYRDALGDIAAREIVLSSGLSTVTPTVLVSMYPSTNQLVRTTPTAVAAALTASGGVLGAPVTFNNMNQVHGAYTDANLVGDFGFRYLQGATNGPNISGASQYYGMTLGLGSNFSFSDFATQFYWPRSPIGGLAYPSIRFKEGGNWGSWTKIYAGWADAPSGSTFAATGDFRAPIFYDAPDTGFYIDPSSTSNISGLTVGNRINGSISGDAQRLFNYTGANNDGLQFWNTVGNDTLNPNTGWHYALRLAHGDADTYYNATLAVDFFADNVYLRRKTGGSNQPWKRFALYDNVYEAIFYASSFSDANNTAFFLDPNNTGTSLNVAGSIIAAGNVTAYSDIRIKANVETIPSALDKLDHIRGVTYTRTDLDDKEQRYAGVIAQEIEAVLPEAVRDLGNIKAVDYNATIALLIQAVKELRDEVEALRK